MSQDTGHTQTKPLDRSLRSGLERTIRAAREIAEAGAKASLEFLGVGSASPFSHLTDKEKEIRRKLRIHGRQLGDRLEPKTQLQDITLLLEEVAYEHWHRMLFARFLAENNLLMYPDSKSPVPVTLEECDELAGEEGARSGWELAARFASSMLPQVFRTDSPVFRLSLPPENQTGLEKLLSDLPTQVFDASDSLGWVYQFWQAKNKKLVGEKIKTSNLKIGPYELPIVTQLFTEPYMVSFLLDNTIGAWWASRKLSETDLINTETEEELRQKASINGVKFEYLRFVRDAENKWTPAAGIFEKWPSNLSELKILDPCCGSGHFLVAALNMLVPMRMYDESLSADEAVSAVLGQNLHGLEIDQRCVELAAFALAFAAWKYPSTSGYRPLPSLNIACSGLPITVSKSEWESLAQQDHGTRVVLGRIYDEFKEAPLFGSLINPKKSLSSQLTQWQGLEPVALPSFMDSKSDERMEMGVIAHGLAKASDLMISSYHLVITNVPYLARAKQGQKLKDFLESNFPRSKNDIATAFLERCLEFNSAGGTSAVVLPQNWLSQITYKDLREHLLASETWRLIARLGSGAFETISGEVVKAILLVMTHPADRSDLRLTGSITDKTRLVDQNHGWFIHGIDVSEPKSAREKASLLIESDIVAVEQARQLDNPDARVVLGSGSSAIELSQYAFSMRGIVSGDSDKWIRKFWELNWPHNRWRNLHSTPMFRSHFTGKEHVIDWSSNGNGMLRPGTTNQAYGNQGVALSQMRNLVATLFDGSLYDNNTGTIIPKNPAHLSAIWCFCSSPEYNEAVRKIDQKLNVTNATLVKVPFDLEKWQKVAAEKYPNGLPKPYSDDPTQWIFHGHPASSTDPLQVAVARLLGYRWPAELDEKMELSDEARRLVGKSCELEAFADRDGIVCIPPVRGESSGSDRLMNLLVASYGNDWNTDVMAQLLASAGHAGKSLDSWLREKFFVQHCKLFHQRPFIWHIWDGLQDGFSVLVNYHRLDRKKLESLIYLYLGDWIKRQAENVATGVDGSKERLAAAETLSKRLQLILEGESPYDIFVRWKSIEQQPIGWEPDINDGVRLNIRPFMSVPDIRKKGAGVLRDKPGIDWKKDRGRDVPSAPWYHIFDGDRINDHHLTLAEKKAARQASGRKVD